MGETVEFLTAEILSEAEEIDKQNFDIVIEGM
jgi:hypothetical protein